MSRPFEELQDRLEARLTPEARAAHDRHLRAELDRQSRGMIGYPVTLEPDTNGTVTLTFVDLPGATFGHSEDDALAHGLDAFLTVFEAFRKDGREFPPPSYAPDSRMLEVPPSLFEHWNRR
jgi:predicted RNase H-like HicB family nuclease